MYKHTISGGQYWLSRVEPRWTDWRGRQAYKYQQNAPANSTSSSSR